MPKHNTTSRNSKSYRKAARYHVRQLRRSAAAEINEQLEDLADIPVWPRQQELDDLIELFA